MLEWGRGGSVCVGVMVGVLIDSSGGGVIVVVDVGVGVRVQWRSLSQSALKSVWEWLLLLGWG